MLLIFFVQSPNERLLWSLYEKTNKNRDLVGKILHNIMKKRLPNTESVPMACLLDWNLWPLFISICRKCTVWLIIK